MNPYLLICLAPLFWAGNFVIGRAVAGGIAPVELAHWRWAVALLCLLPFGLPALRRQWSLIRPVLWRMLLLAVLGVACFNTLVYVGLQDTPASKALLIVSTIPLLILALSRLIYATPVRPRQLLGVLISLTGIVLIVSGGDWRVIATLSFNRGDLWILAAAACWSFYSLWLRWKPPALSPLAFLSFTVIVGYALLALLYWPNVLAGAPLPEQPWQWLVIGYTGVFASVVAFLSWNQGVKQLGPATASQFIHLQLVFGTLLAMVFLGESLRGADALGAILIAAGILLSLRRNAA